jgi:MSHA biogenesis protein MshE
MGTPSYMVASSVHAVLAQRLVRLICESCITEAQPTAQEARWLEAVGGVTSGLKKGQGCSHCNGIGYVGRSGVYEMLEMTPDLVRAANASDPNLFLAAARPQLKGRTLTDHALALVKEGRTTVSEAMKVAVQLED